MVTLEEYARQEEKANLDNKFCYLCERKPAELTDLTCDICGAIFWRGYLCKRALEAFRKNPIYMLDTYFPGAHACLR